VHSGAAHRCAGSHRLYQSEYSASVADSRTRINGDNRGSAPATRNKVSWHARSRGRYRRYCLRDGNSWIDFDHIFRELIAQERFEMRRTLKQLIECYQADPDSNFLKLQYQVRVKHGRLLARLSEEHGSDQLRNVRFRNLTVWYNAWVSDGKIAMARSMVDRLRELFRFGATLLEDRECARLFEAVGKLRLENSTPRTVQMTAEHANAIRKTAREQSFWGDERKFLEPPMRFTRGDVRDHTVSSKIDHGPPSWR
jgi:hypothetical protein